MRTMRHALAAATCGLIVDVLAPLPALAYLDPGTGSLVFQWVIAGVVGGALGIKLFARRIAGAFKGRSGRPAEDEA
jgi:hypothetical protein